MEKLILNLDPSIKTKFIVKDFDNNLIYRGSDSWFSDFWNTFLGWIISLPNQYRFHNDPTLKLKRLFSSMKVKFTGTVDDKDIQVLINNPSLRRSGKAAHSSVNLNGHEYHVYRGQRSRYFSLFDDQNKVFAMKRDDNRRDVFKSVYNDSFLSKAEAAIIMITLADSI